MVYSPLRFPKPPILKMMLLKLTKVPVEAPKLVSLSEVTVSELMSYNYVFFIVLFRLSRPPAIRILCPSYPDFPATRTHIAELLATCNYRLLFFHWFICRSYQNMLVNLVDEFAPEITKNRSVWGSWTLQKNSGILKSYGATIVFHLCNFIS